MAAVMNNRGFVTPPWIDFDGTTYTVVVHAYHWNGHPDFGFSVHRTPFKTLPEAAAYLGRLGFTIDPNPLPLEA
jgi:hypothetical protein